MLWFIRHIREKHQLIEREADVLIEAHGDLAYVLAREKARTFIASDPKQWKFWGKVAICIAKKTGYTIGEKVADRYLRRD